MRVLLAALLVVALSVALVIFITRTGSRQQVADVFVLMQPFTNAVLAADFQRKIKRAEPWILELHFQKTSAFVNGPNQQRTTNTQVVIQIAVVGEDAGKAVENANQIAPLVCDTIKEAFPNASVSVLNPAVGARERTAPGHWRGLRLGDRREFEPTIVSGDVAFVGTGIILTPGDDWQQHYIAGMPCPPALVGVEGRKGQFLSANLCDPGVDSIEAAVTARAETIKGGTVRVSTTDSLQTDNFTAESGLYGVRISYYQNDSTSGRVLRSRHSEYFTTNAAGRFVRITYIALASDQTNEFHHQILHSLRLK